MIVVHPVVELHFGGGFSLWPVGEPAVFDFLRLHGGMSPVDIGTAVMLIAACNDVEGLFPEEHPPRPAEPLDRFLHPLLASDGPFVAGGMRITDTTTGAVLLPGCCSDLNEWRDWLDYLDGRSRRLDLGHDPFPLVEVSGGTVRLTPDQEQRDGPVIETSAPGLRRLVAEAETDLTGFLRSAGAWAEQCLPGRSARLTAALGRALDVAPPQVS
ncbi:hypothetical protein ACIRPH_10775 [Nocardiopsis sp. NPDC101807]|uniref:hypothetical protein n=1 Tax=Nocardiopsis sp. NPDC101807 TaxID=3364339 RepID=UPI0038224739